MGGLSITRSLRSIYANIKIGPGAPPIRTDKGWLLLIHGVEVLDTSIDYDTHTAITQLKLDGELNVAKLPAKFRNSLRIDDPAALRQPREVPVHWVWVEGDWYYKVESAINNGSVSGSQGDQEVTPLSELPE